MAGFGRENGHAGSDLEENSHLYTLLKHPPKHKIGGGPSTSAIRTAAAHTRLQHVFVVRGGVHPCVVQSIVVAVAAAGMSAVAMSCEGRPQSISA